jgi:hypothetical protein
MDAVDPKQDVKDFARWSIHLAECQTAFAQAQVRKCSFLRLGVLESIPFMRQRQLQILQMRQQLLLSALAERRGAGAIKVVSMGICCRGGDFHNEP